MSHRQLATHLYQGWQTRCDVCPALRSEIAALKASLEVANSDNKKLKAKVKSVDNLKEESRSDKVLLGNTRLALDKMRLEAKDMKETITKLNKNIEIAESRFVTYKKAKEEEISDIKDKLKESEEYLVDHTTG